LIFFLWGGEPLTTIEKIFVLNGINILCVWVVCVCKRDERLLCVCVYVVCVCVVMENEGEAAVGPSFDFGKKRIGCV